MTQGSGNEVVIPIRIEAEDAKYEINQVKKLLNKGFVGEFNVSSLVSYENKLKELQGTLGNIGSGSVLGISKNFGSAFTDINKEISSLGSSASFDFGGVVKKTLQDLTEQVNVQGKAWEQLPQMLTKPEASFKSIDKVLEDVSKGVKEASIPFAGYAMSIMFAGMQIQQMFTGLGKAAMATFQDISHSVEGMVTSTDLLSAEWTYLKFNIGEALEPVVSFLVPIVAAVADWISENQALSAAIVSLGVVLGTVFFIGGAAVLGLNGFIELFSRLGWVVLDTEGKIVGMSAATKASLSGIAWPVLLGVAAAAAVLYSLEKTPDAMSAVKTSATRLKEPFQRLWDSIEDAVAAIFNMDDATGAIAWTFAWMADLAVSQLTNIINVVTIIIDSFVALKRSISAVTNSWKAMWMAVAGDEDAERDYWRKVDADLLAMEESLGSVSTAWASINEEAERYTQTLFDGPEAFKQAQLALKGPNASFIDDVPASFMPALNFTPDRPYSTQPANFQTEQGKSVYVTGPIYIQANNTEEILASFRSMSQ